MSCGNGQCEASEVDESVWNIMFVVQELDTVCIAWLRCREIMLIEMQVSRASQPRDVENIGKCKTVPLRRNTAVRKNALVRKPPPNVDALLTTLNVGAKELPIG